MTTPADKLLTVRRLLSDLLEDLEYHAEHEGDYADIRTEKGWIDVDDAVRSILGVITEPEEKVAPEPEPEPEDKPLTDLAEAYAAALNERYKGFRHYSVMKGRKYNRIVAADIRNGVVSEQRSVHCFTDNTGGVYKADGWNRPASGVRFCLHTEHELRDHIAKLADHDWAGGYLYLRG